MENKKTSCQQLNGRESTMPKKILCAVDGSYSANRAAACAADLAKDMGAKLTFIHVNTVPPERMARTVYFWDETLLSAVDAQIHTQLAHAYKAAAEHGVTNFDGVVVTGDKASTAIASYAKQKAYDHIVMGTDVTNALERIVLGSVATEVVSKAHCPVTIVHSPSQ
jgi:nucleotide-binding universal stress UspA family protein